MGTNKGGKKNCKKGDEKKNVRARLEWGKISSKNATVNKKLLRGLGQNV